MKRHTQSTPYSIDPASGLVAPGRHCPSPNQDERPIGSVAELIVIHAISLPPARFGGGFIESFFCNALDVSADPYFESIADLRVSAHALIARDGSLTQFVPFHRRAWHAGQSQHRGRENCNDFSVGIELEGTDEHSFESAQYGALAALIEALRAAYPTLRGAPVVGHSDIAPGRKTDPGPNFDWRELNALLGASQYTGITV